jgi:glyoxylase-like metal-dependent hydrolase (beta-lactamase superfamily II)
MRRLFCPELLDTGPLGDALMVVRDGAVNFFILRSDAGLICVDTGWRPAKVRRGFEGLGLSIRDVRAVLVTHLHWDHARCLGLFPGAEVFVGEHEEPSVLARRINAGQVVTRVQGGQAMMVCGLAVQVVATPGHTSSSVSYVVDGSLIFTGDSVRLKCGEIMPSWSWLNQDMPAAARSVRTIAGIHGIRYLLTSHHGLICRTGTAFSQWNKEADGLVAGVGGRS